MADGQSPHTLPNTLESLLAAAARDPAERPAFTRALLESDVFVLGSLDRPAVAGLAQPGTTVRLVAWTDADGSITPFFTSEETLRRTLAVRPGTDPGFVRLRCRDLFAMTAGERLVLNPDGPDGKLFLAAELEAMLAGTEPGRSSVVTQTEERVLVGAPARVPPALPQVLARYFAKRPGVARAHLGWIAHPDGRHGYLVVVAAEDRDAALAGFGSMQIGELTGGETLDVIVVAPGSRDHLLSTLAPFYTRE